MANVYDPRLSSVSSSSSENDIVDDVFLHPGKGAAAPIKFGFNHLGMKKSRALSEPVMLGKEINREDLKGLGMRSQALSDSSNFVKRVEEAGSGKSSSSSCQDLKSKGSPGADSSEGFPEPESFRKEAVKSSRHFSILFEENEEEEGFGSPGLFVEDHGGVTGDIFDSGNTFLGDLAFEMSRNVTVNAPSEAVSTIQPVEDDDGSMYPELECFPTGYGCCAYDNGDFKSVISAMDVPKLVLRSFDGAGTFPELPDDLIKEENASYNCYSEMDLPEAEVPELPMRKLWLVQ